MSNHLPKVPRTINGVLMMVSLCPPGAASLPLDLIETDGEPEMPPEMSRILQENLRSSACEDDPEMSAPFISDGEPFDDEGEGQNTAEIMGFASMPRREREDDDLIFVPCSEDGAGFIRGSRARRAKASINAQAWARLGV